MRKMRAKDATYREIGAAVGMRDPKTVKRILDRKVDHRMLERKPETTQAPRGGKNIARIPRGK
jgi:hypothetical protein